MKFWPSRGQTVRIREKREGHEIDNPRSLCELDVPCISRESVEIV